MMKLPIGEEFFGNIRTKGFYYVDKTRFIADLLKNRGSVNLFTRPRRFGKSLNLDMLKTFFEIGTDAALFEGLEIEKEAELCERHMGKYPVIMISLKDVTGASYEEALKVMSRVIKTEARRHQYLLESNKLTEIDKESLRELYAKYLEEDVQQESIRLLSEMLNKHYGKGVIILIDEYDVPLDKAYQNHYYTQMVHFIRSVFSQALKTNKNLEFAVITGCLRIARESIFTGLNHFKIRGISDVECAEYFGFTDDEVRTMMEYYGVEDRFSDVKEWYDGYHFGAVDVYCPWDVMNYMSALKKRENAKPKNYWKNTSHNGILLTFVKRTDFKVRGKFEILMNGGTITQTISDELTYDTLHSSEDNLWSVILMTGYLTKADAGEEGETVRLKIPNREIASIFEDTVVKLFQDTMDDNCRKDMMEALWRGDEQEASEAISNLLWKTISYNDYHEDYYHAFLAGAFVGLGYEVESNKEKGLGRPDIFLRDDDNRRVIIIETKRSKKEDDLDQDCDRAVDQILSKKYAEGLYGYTQIFCYGIAFFQKQARVKRLL